MVEKQKQYQKKLVILITILLLMGFLTTSLVSYYVSAKSLRENITHDGLPLTSDNIYSDIQNDLLKHVSISSLMANDTFVRDWVIKGENNPDEMTRYLKEIQEKYGTLTCFFVSEKTRIYYSANGIIKTVKEDEERDVWYFRVREMDKEHEINVDPDMANNDKITIFINFRVYDFDHNYIGAIGVGLEMMSVKSIIDKYSQKYNRDVDFVDKSGNIFMHSGPSKENKKNINEIDGLGALTNQILTTNSHQGKYYRNGKLKYVNSRFIDDLELYLLVSQTEDQTVQPIFNALVINVVLCLLITAVVLTITLFVVNKYQTKIKDMAIQEHEMKLKNEKQEKELEKALEEVKILSGFLPICASCKKIRDDKGYWNQLETYIKEHADVEFSHGICPDCMTKLYPDISNDEIS